MIAGLNAACWSIITPPFQVPDEPAHFAYTQQLAQNERLPTAGGSYSPEEGIVLRDIHQKAVKWHPEVGTISSAEEQRQLQIDLAQHPSRAGVGAGVAASQPPLYYLLEAIPYGLGSGGTLLDQLELMRLLSALMAAITAFFVFLFVRETLPSASWAWTVGGLSVALAPLLGFMSGAVNPDSMLAAVSAATFYCLARGFRCGLTRNLAIAIGTASAIGFLTKLNFIGLAPGVILGLFVLAIRAWRAHGLIALRHLALALAIAVSPVGLYLFVNLASGRPGLGIVSNTIDGWHRGFVFREIGYIWQFYLPRLPGMANDFPGLSTTRQIWFDRSVGLYGWLDTSFPVWVDTVALVAAGLIALLYTRSLVVVRAVLRERLVEFLVYLVMTIGLLALIGASSYLNVSNEGGGGWAHPRYLLPLLPLLGAVLALAARGAGRRWGPAVGALIVVLFLAHDIFSQLQVIARFYG
ncbi:MAG TPA: DUF2142 domain-containing protein [Polyangia bacterium]|nr:DUF2142 domain-containing protein [Polyangia bacterium]